MGGMKLRSGKILYPRPYNRGLGWMKLRSGRRVGAWVDKKKGGRGHAASVSIVDAVPLLPDSVPSFNIDDVDTDTVSTVSIRD